MNTILFDLMNLMVISTADMQFVMQDPKFSVISKIILKKSVKSKFFKVLKGVKLTSVKLHIKLHLP